LFAGFPVTGAGLVDLALVLVMPHDLYLSRSSTDKAAAVSE
jgi:hypothetical protein